MVWYNDCRNYFLFLYSCCIFKYLIVLFLKVNIIFFGCFVIEFSKKSKDMLLFIISKKPLFISNSLQNWTPLLTSQTSLVTSHKAPAFVEVHIRRYWCPWKSSGVRYFRLKAIKLTQKIIFLWKPNLQFTSCSNRFGAKEPFTETYFLTYS